MQPPDIFSVTWLLAFSAVVFAAFVRGISGFGLSLVLAPVLLLILNSKSIVAINLVLAALSNVMVITYSFRHINYKGILPMVICNLFGIPLGLWILKSIDPSMLKVLVGAVTVVFAIPMALGVTRVFAREKLAGGIAGFFSGLIGTATSLGGPPVVMFMHNQKWPKEIIHSSLSAYFLVTAPMSLIALFATGLVDTGTFVFTASLLPGLVIGILLGILAFRRINQRIFRLLSLAVIIVAGTVGIISGSGIFP